MKRNILFYFPSNRRAVSIESLAFAFQNAGHRVIFLAQEEHGPLHEALEAKGIECLFYPIPKNNSFTFYLKHAFKLAQVVRKHKIDVVFSNVQVANLPAVLAQFLCRARIVIGRHHTDTGAINQIRNEVRIDRIINFLGREFIVPGDMVMDSMLREGVDPAKIRLIRYGYDFSEYGKPDPNKVAELKSRYSADLLIVKVARFFPEKRHLILLQTLDRLKREGFNIQCLFLSDGPYRKVLEDFISSHNLTENVHLFGFRNDILNYLAAADVIIHLSSSEASNNLIKEAGLIRKPVVVCRSVGDFDEYLINGKNAWVIDKDNPEAELEEIIRKLYRNPETAKAAAIMGDRLHDDVLELFSIDKVIKGYDYYLSSGS